MTEKLGIDFSGREAGYIMEETNMNLLNEYHTFLKIKNYKQRGIVEKLRYAKIFIDYLNEKRMNIGNLSIKEANIYREYLCFLNKDTNDSRYNPKTINCIISSLRLFYSYLLSRGLSINNPFNNIERMRELSNIPRNVLTIEEMNRLLSGIRIDDKNDFKFRMLIEILYSTGCRISEIENITIEDVNLEYGFIKITDDKERKDRIAILNEVSLIFLKLYLEYVYNKSDKKLFNNNKNRTLNQWLNKRLKKVTGQLQLPEMSCHGIRHTIATHLLKKGADIREVQEFLGHKKIKNTEIYTHIFPDDLKEIIEKNHPREKRYKNEI